jgi:sulfatase maturation enzyme AslB (radical SAM superfamily)
MTKIHSLDLSLTNQCNANCIYCPSPRIKNKKRFMSLKEVNKLINNLLFKDFLLKFGYLNTIEIGGLAEPLLHPRLIDILRLFKRSYRTRNMLLYTNALRLEEKTILRIVEERLITALVVSVDGYNSREYYEVKGLDYSAVKHNLERFIALRNKYFSRCKLIINVLTYNKYYNLIRAILKREPLNAPGDSSSLTDNTEKIISKWRGLCSDKDEVRDAAAGFQLRGEYQKDNDRLLANENDLKCPWVEYVTHAINITSNGDWIFCCNDFYKDDVLGNFLRTSIYKIAISDKRNNFITALKNNDFNKLPLRCRQKKYCQFLGVIKNKIEFDRG